MGVPGLWDVSAYDFWIQFIADGTLRNIAATSSRRNILPHTPCRHRGLRGEQVWEEGSQSRR